MAGWYTPNDINAEVWKNAPQGEELDGLLDAAREQCIAFAPALAENAPIPGNYRLAHLLQAKALYAAQQGPGPDDQFGGGEAGGVRVYDMGATVRRLLRPMRGLPGIG